jgi:integrase
MAINKLKDRQIENLPAGPKGRAKLHADGGGLFVNVRGKIGSESRSYVFKGTLHGKQLTTYIGPTAKTPLAVARTERDKLNAQIKAGKDPRSVKAAKKVQQDGPPPTVTRLLNRYFEDKIEPKGHQHETEDVRRDRINKARRYLDQINTAIGRLPVAEVKVETILTALKLEELAKTKATSVDELRLHLKRAFGIAAAIGWRDGCNPPNPASDEILNAILPNWFRKRERRKGLDYLDAPQFVAEVKARKSVGLGKEGQDLLTAPALLFLVYTGVRTNEVRKAKWKEIDEDNLLWNVPSDHRKKGHTKNKVRAIPISKAMMEVLKGQQKKYPNATGEDFIFPGNGRNGGLGRGVILGFIRNTLKWNVSITVHGFRSTLSAWAKAQRPHYQDIFIKAQFDHLGKRSEDDDSWSRPSVADTHYGHADRPDMTDPTIEGPSARREMTERYGAYLNSYKLKGTADE